MKPFLTTERLFLTPITKEFCNERYLNWLNDTEVTEYMESGRFPTTLQNLKEFIDAQSHRQILFLAILLKDSKLHIGNIKIDQIHPIHRTAEYGIFLGEKSAWGKGYAQEASKTVIDYCFNVLNVRKITLGVIATHQTAVKLYSSLGFKTEGTLKDHYFHQGRYQDVLRMALFKNG